MGSESSMMATIASRRRCLFFFFFGGGVSHPQHATLPLLLCILLIILSPSSLSPFSSSSSSPSSSFPHIEFGYGGGGGGGGGGFIRSVSAISDWMNLVSSPVNLTIFNETVAYLVRYGYLPPDFDINNPFIPDVLKATQHLQVFFNLTATGDIDNDTIAVVQAPRCGFRDIYRPNDTASNPNFNGSSGVMAYSFFPDMPKWSKSKRVLKWFLVNTTEDTPDIAGVKEQVTAAFRTWQALNIFNFTEVNSAKEADVQLVFKQTEEGFGSVGKILALAYAPEDGRLFLDEGEFWALDAGSSRLSNSPCDLQSVVLHELGHILGLGHTNVKDAIMYPSIRFGQSKRGLHQDDRMGLRELYDIKDTGTEGSGDASAALYGGCPCLGISDGLYDYLGDSWECRRACRCNSGIATVLVCRTGWRIAKDGQCHRIQYFVNSCSPQRAISAAEQPSDPLRMSAEEATPDRADSLRNNGVMEGKSFQIRIRRMMRMMIILMVVNLAVVVFTAA